MSGGRRPRPGGRPDDDGRITPDPASPPLRTLYARVLLTLGERVVVANRRGASWYFLLGGHVQPGEGVEETLLRVLRRTAGFELRSLDFVGAIEHVYEDGRPWHQVNIVFAGEVPRYADLGSRVDDIHLVTMPVPALADIEFRPAHLHSMITTWLARRRPQWHGPRH